MKFNNPMKMLRTQMTNLSPLFILIPAVLLLSALFIRIFTGSSILIYGAAENRGFFPGPFMYTVGYILRIVLSGFVIAALITSCSLYENRTKLIIMSVISSFLVLFEYKLIFISIKLFTAVVVSAVSAVMWLFIAIKCKRQDKRVFMMSLSAFILELIFVIQLVSLILSV